MCGINCFVDVDGHHASDSSAVKQRLERGLDAIAHRGPDGRGTWASEDGRVGLGHVRLAIMGPDARGAQPMAHSSNPSIRITHNGEFYDWEELLRNTCPEYKPSSASDSELLLALYQHYDGRMADVLPHLRGEFAFVLHDETQGKLYAVRDRYGVKPLYYHAGSQLAICSEIKGLLAMGCPAKWDLPRAINEGWRTGDGTLLSGVRWVKPGCMLEVDLTTRRITERNWWVRQFRVKSMPEERPIDAMVEGVRSRLIDAIKVRLRADVPVGVFLSGGVDSSAVAGIVSHLLKTGAAPCKDSSLSLKNFRCFTINFDHEWSEAAIAKNTAAFVGAQYCPLDVTEEMLCDNFEEVIAQCELPYADLGCVAKYLLAKFAKQQGVDVVLTGEGSDEHLAGYPIFRGDRFAEPADEQDDKMPDEELLRPLPSFYGLPTDKPRPSTSAPSPALARLAMSGMLSTSHHHSGLTSWAEAFIDPHGDASLHSLLSMLPTTARQQIESDAYHPLHTALLVYQSSTFVTQQLTHLGDRVEMAHALEARTPFLDHHLTEFIDSLPPSVKLRLDPRTGALREKWILYEAVRPFVTPEVYGRVKQPFVAAPRRYARDGPMHRLLKRLLSREGIEAVGWLDVARVEALMRIAFGSDEEGKEGEGATEDPREAKLATAQALLCAEMCLFAKRWGVERVGSEEEARMAVREDEEVRRRVQRVE